MNATELAYSRSNLYFCADSWNERKMVALKVVFLLMLIGGVLSSSDLR